MSSDLKRSLIWCKMSSNYRCVPSARPPPLPHRRGVTAHFPPQRNLNNAFAYDLVPSPSVVAAALKAARRVNDYPTAVRVFEGNLLPPS